MRTTNYTLGPWTASYSDADGFSHINSSTWGGLAKVPVMIQDSYSDSGVLTPSVEGEANARLISSAPELLQALRDLQQELHRVLKLDVKKHYSLMVADAVANKVIAKAEGK
jgi:hypothetical protein